MAVEGWLVGAAVSGTSLGVPGFTFSSFLLDWQDNADRRALANGWEKDPSGKEGHFRKDGYHYEVNGCGKHLWHPRTMRERLRFFGLESTATMGFGLGSLLK